MASNSNRSTRSHSNNDRKNTQNDITRRCQALRRISIEHNEIETKYHEMRDEVYKKYSNFPVFPPKPRRSLNKSYGPTPSGQIISGTRWFEQVARRAKDLRQMALSHVNYTHTFGNNKKEIYCIRRLLERCEFKCHEMLTHLANLDWELHEFEESIGQYHAEIESIMTQYNMELSRLYQRRLAIIRGTHDPTDEESAPIDQTDCSMLIRSCCVDSNLEVHEKINNFKAETLISLEPRAMPLFWLRSLVIGLRQVDVIQADDWAPLSYLHDVRYYYDTWRDATYREPMDWMPSTPTDPDKLPPVNLDTDHRTQSLLFFFDKNPHFSNRILSKTLHIDRSGRDGVKSFDGFSIMYCEGCTINWFQGKNLTKQKEPSKPLTRRLATEARLSASGHFKLEEDQDEFFGKRPKRSPDRASFFNFFGEQGLGKSGQEAPGQGQDPELDYEVFVHLRDFVVPNAVVAYSEGNHFES